MIPSSNEIWNALGPRWSSSIGWCWMGCHLRPPPNVVLCVRIAFVAERGTSPGKGALGHEVRPLEEVSEESQAPWVVFVEAGQRLVALVIENGHALVIDLVSSALAARRVALLQRDLSRYLRAVGRGVEGDGSRLDAAAAELDAMLLAPLHLATERIVICPTASIYDLSWGLLPSLRSKSFVLAPSIALYRRSNEVRDVSNRSVLVAGPGLMHAEAEVAAIGSVYRSAEVLIGDAATVDTVRAAIEGARIAHLVCHGHFVTTSPLFSSLTLRDGRLFAHDLERLQPTPTIAVLSACHGGTHATPSGARDPRSHRVASVRWFAGGGRSNCADSRHGVDGGSDAIDSLLAHDGEQRRRRPARCARSQSSACRRVLVSRSRSHIVILLCPRADAGHDRFVVARNTRLSLLAGVTSPKATTLTRYLEIAERVQMAKLALQVCTMFGSEHLRDDRVIEHGDPPGRCRPGGGYFQGIRVLAVIHNHVGIRKVTSASLWTRSHVVARPVRPHNHARA